MALPRSSPPLRAPVRDLLPALIATRRDFHQHPELSWKEARTQRVIVDRLVALGLADMRAIARTGATALIRGRSPGPCVAWRADIDALPVTERSSQPWTSSNPGVMHACGHDAHIAIALGIAEVLAQAGGPARGDVRLIFQPAEEARGGAAACIEAGVLDDPKVSHVLGLHISADVPIGAINLAPGPFFAAPTGLEIEIAGRGGHAAAPHQGVDAVLVAAHLITALHTVVSRSVAPADSAVLTIGKVEAGVRRNVLAERALLSGTIRAYSDRVRDGVVARVQEIAGGVGAAFGATCTVTTTAGCPALVNDPGATATVLAEAAGFFGADHIAGVPSMGADDMAVFLQHRPGCYFWLGARNEPAGIAGRHHDPEFAIDESALGLGVEFGLRIIERFLAE